MADEERRLWRKPWDAHPGIERNRNDKQPDKYDRYVSDVFLQMESSGKIFLSNTVHENGHAVRKDSYAQQDWPGNFGSDAAASSLTAAPKTHGWPVRGS